MRIKDCYYCDHKEQPYKPFFIGIDPGIASTGIAILDDFGKLVKLEIIKSSPIHEKKSIDAIHRSAMIANRIKEIKRCIPSPHDSLVGVEYYTPYGPNTSGYKTLITLGAIITVFETAYNITPYMPMRIKKSATGNRKAAKEEVYKSMFQKYAVRQLFNKTDLEHVGDALAIADLVRKEWNEKKTY